MCNGFKKIPTLTLWTPNAWLESKALALGIRHSPFAIRHFRCR
ncbi:hypothetical protein BGP_5814 [Beggiatoa sp. PS]|nr:hypothetical protein BGP_5814 [Beggiatoa sp. PS]